MVLPARCVFAAATETCSLSIDHYRDRKTGPGFPLAVVGCRRHPICRFTLYPPGHIPYGRQAVVSCSPLGPLLQDPITGQPEWPTTLLPWSPSCVPKRKPTPGLRSRSCYVGPERAASSPKTCPWTAPRCGAPADAWACLPAPDPASATTATHHPNRGTAKGREGGPSDAKRTRPNHRKQQHQPAHKPTKRDSDAETSKRDDHHPHPYSYVIPLVQVQ